MKIANRVVHREFAPLEKYEAGIVLSGAEVKAVRTGSMRLEKAYVRFIDNELYLVNAEISIYKFSRPQEYNPSRSRKLLLNRSELLRLQTKLKSAPNLTIVPIACYNKKSLIKLEIALAKGKKTWEIKRIDQRKDEDRKAEKELKEYLKS